MSPDAQHTAPTRTRPSKDRSRSRGQVLIIYVMAVFVFIGMLAIVLDISWYWINSNRVQKAADAAALAGVVWLPADEPKAVQTAIYEAAKNGYTVASSGVAVNGVTLTAGKAGDGRRLIVSITAPVPTFFMRVFGLNSIPATRSARAEYVSPVAMGSPENYYGVFGDVRGATMTTTTTTTTADPPTTADGFTTPQVPSTATPASAATGWTSSSATTNSANLVSNVSAVDSAYAFTTTNGRTQQWRNFNIAFPALTGSEVSRSILGIQVNLDAKLSATCTNAGQVANQSRVGVDLTWNNSTNWSTVVNSGVLTGAYQLLSVGSAANTTAWGPATPHTWATGDFTNTNFRVRWTAIKGASCAAGTEIRVDRLRVQVFYRTTSQTYTTTTTPNTTPPADYPLYGPGAACANGVSDCYTSTLLGGGQDLNDRGFWATMNTEGAPNLNGDAFQPYYDSGTTVAPVCPTATLRACYDPDNYYNYAVEMPPNSTGGYVYIFDPVFCATAVGSGTGDRHFNGDSDAVSSFYELYDTGTSLFTRADDTLIVSSLNTFGSMAYTDGTMMVPQTTPSAAADCRQKATPYGDARDYHDSWYRLNPSDPLTGGPTGTIYRVHTTGTNPSNVAQQRIADGEQSFAIFATGSALPKVYGIGAMQMFTPLEASATPDKVSSFYLAQIDPIHAGRTLELHLWDPGDTGNLLADLAIMIPTSTVGVWAPTPFSYSAKVGTSGSGPNTACNTNTGTAVMSVRSNNGGGAAGNFNGCWLTIDVQIPPGYTGFQQGWWQIRYTMHNIGSPDPGVSSDVTTWTAEIQGNPVHLVAP